MQPLFRLIYVSEATFNAKSESNSIEPEVADILTSARQNNQTNNIGGVLFFANGYFFQCLEGKKSAVYETLERIQKDSRHKNLKISYGKKVRRRAFRSWTMEYVPVCQEVKELIVERG